VNAALRLRRRGLAAAAIAASALAATPPASAADPPPAVDPAIAQYVEMVPTATGPVAAGRGKGAAKVPPATEKQIEKEAGTNAELLTKVVSSEAYGAPTEYQAPPARAPAAPASPAQPTPAPAPAKPAPVRPKNPAAQPEPAAQPAPKPLPRVPLPPAPNPLSAAFGTLGTGGALFVLALAGAIGLGVGARLARAGSA
jgi:hypothetical protein